MDLLNARNAAALAITAIIFATVAPQAHAQETVECRSHNYEYTECQAPLEEPQLIHQISSTSCIINRTWGFNPNTHRLWVAEGCAGVFADPEGYHYGRGDRYDANARHYDEHGHDAGKVAAGVVAAVLVGAAIEKDSKKHKDDKHYTTSNNYYSHPSHKKHDKSGSKNVDTRPSFDKEGNPNFDTHGRYIGCHGAGCKVDNPDD